MIDSLHIFMSQYIYCTQLKNRFNAFTMGTQCVTCIKMFSLE